MYALPKAGTAVESSNALVEPNRLFASGAITVAGSNEKFAVNVANPGEAEREVTITVVGSTGKLLATKKGIVGPDDTLTLTFDPGSTTTMRAEISFASEVSIQDDTIVPSAELRMVNGTAVTTKAILGDFKGFEDLGL